MIKKNTFLRCLPLLSLAIWQANNTKTIINQPVWGAWPLMYNFEECLCSPNQTLAAGLWAWPTHPQYPVPDAARFCSNWSQSVGPAQVAFIDATN